MTNIVFEMARRITYIIEEKLNLREHMGKFKEEYYAEVEKKEEKRKSNLKRMKHFEFTRSSTGYVAKSFAIFLCRCG